MTFRIDNFARYSQAKAERQAWRLRQDMKVYREERDLRLLHRLGTEGLVRPVIEDSSDSSEEGEEEHCSDEELKPHLLVKAEMSPQEEALPPPPPEVVIKSEIPDVDCNDDFNDMMDYGGGGESTDDEALPLKKKSKKRKTKDLSGGVTKKKRKTKEQSGGVAKKKRKTKEKSVAKEKKKSEVPCPVGGYHGPQPPQEKEEVFPLIDDDYDYKRGTGHYPPKNWNTTWSWKQCTGNFIGLLSFSTLLTSVWIKHTRYPKWPNTPEFLKKILDRGNLDDDFTLGTTRSGAPKLLYRGHLFYRFKETYQRRCKGNIVKWYCMQGQCKSVKASGIDCKVSYHALPLI